MSAHQHAMTDRSVAFLLASLLTAYPDASFLSHIRLLLEDKRAVEHFSRLSSWTQAEQCLREVLKGERPIEDLQASYVSRFDRGRSVAPLYESEYSKGRTLAKGTDLSDIAGFYRAFGFQLGDGTSTFEMYDHISVELEFYSLMVAKQDYQFQTKNFEAVEILFDARRKFMDAHLGRFVPAVAAKVEALQDPYFGSVYHWVRDLVADECLGLGVASHEVLQSAQYFPDVSCGASATSET